MADVSKVTFKKVKEDANGGRQWHVDAIHVTTTRNNRVYTEAELRLAARGLSYRPININHDEGRFLNYDFREPTSPYSNTTLIMDFSPEKNAVSGDLWITDPVINQKIEKGDIQTVSIEQTPYKGESCSCNAAHSCTCEQHGIVFSAIAILETSKGVQPGDPNAIIKATEAKKEDDDAPTDNKCDDGYHYDKEAGKCVKDDDEKPAEEAKPCPCALERALGTELFNELKKAEKFLETGEI